MKKLGKLGINSEKIMKNEELVTLRGGYDGACSCFCMSSTYPYPDQGYLLSASGDCSTDCNYAFGSPGNGSVGFCGNPG